ncbi:mechanosensitive ion channel family protein [Opitutus sp. ER46]|uniref:mechanosensitive ion channel family protein n=1 Tax=Opitutus sp. ER46 TaxID=2161864 RepID=UPI000D2F88CF|nr:mechanosensitive ion channel family protein [Opitutus sp. ER46]PTX98587.1 mechanosensitive ion channel family protein [Opitutus sp. ER46]
MTTRFPDLTDLLPTLAAAVPTALLIGAGAIFLHFALRRGLRVLTRRTSFTEADIAPVQRFLKWVIVIAALVLILGAFGLNVGGFWGVISTILAMVAIGFVAVWSVLSNTLCTVIIMLYRPFSVGDEVEFVGEQVKGVVADLNFVYTTLDAGDGSVMQVPNNLFFQRVIRRRRGEATAAAVVPLRPKPPESDAPAPVPAT